MKRLTGTYQGITFDQGKFSADCFTKVYWNTLKVQDEAIEDGVFAKSSLFSFIITQDFKKSKQIFSKICSFSY